MKDSLRYLRSTPSFHALLCAFLSLLFIFSNADRSYAKTVIVGTGSGELKITMSGLSAGDIVLVKPGNYAWGTMNDLHDITIMNNGGLVTFANTMYTSNWVNVTFTGTGASGIKYGFQFKGVNNAFGNIGLDGHNQNTTWSNIEFLNTTSDAFDNQQKQTPYDGNNDATKRLLNCKFTNLHMDNASAFISNYRGAFVNVVDNCEFSYVVVDHWNTTILINSSAFFRSQIHHWTIGQQIANGANDVGCFQINGSPSIHECYEYGLNWGWFCRINQQSLNQRDDCRIYNNIRVGSTNYGFMDYRQDATSIYSNTTRPFLRGGDMYVANNTCGNLITVNHYLTTIVVAYNFPGQHLYIWNNLRFNSINLNAPDSQNVVHYGSSADLITQSNNVYIANAILSGLITDAVTCNLKAGSPLIDAGIPVNFVTTDIDGVPRPQGKGYDIGAKEYNQNTPPPPTTNKTPVANAGADQTITLPTNSVSLDGTKSVDSDGTISSYQWQQVSGPSTANIGSATSSTTTVSALQQGTYQFKLTVTDNAGATASATVTITVNAAAQNQPPVADAGSDLTITLPTSSATLDGSKSSDAEGNITYSWTKVSGPGNPTINNATSVKANVTGLAQGTYVFQLTVTDAAGATSSDSVTVTVNGSANVPPVANAGNTTNINLPADSSTLDGSGSYDPDGTVVSYRWQQISGPAGAVISDSTAIQPTVYKLDSLAGYTFQLTVTDNNGATATDQVTVYVKAGNGSNPAPNIPPVANAGTDQTITLPTSSVNLDGSKSMDSDGNIKQYAWVQVAGPVTATIRTASSSKTGVSGLTQQGVYTFALTVTDDSAATDVDSVNVVVKPAAVVPNVAPVADAGKNGDITLPTSTYNLSAANSYDPDGYIAKYQWAEISGPNAATFGSDTTVTTQITGLIAGTYNFQLIVTDNSGASDTAKVMVVVHAAAAPPPAKTNQAPTAVAGSDITITLPTSSVNLDGSASSDPDGKIVKWAWSEISGPSSASFGSAAGAKTSVSGLQQGTYVFQLTVTDDSAATASDQITVKVNAASTAPNELPVANAGNNSTITLPTSSVTLDGVNSFDQDGSITKYAWSEVSGPSTAAIADAGAETTTASGLKAGTYVFQLIVTDNMGATSKDQVTVTVNPASGSTTPPDTTKTTQPVTANQAPDAIISADTSITLPNTSTVLTGSGSSDPDGSISSYQWQETSGPNSASVSSTSSPDITVSSLVPGDYEFELTVVDNKGAVGHAKVKITVHDQASGVDQLILYPNPTVDLIKMRMMARETGSVTIEVFDMGGRAVKRQTYDKQLNVVEAELIVSDLPAGMYTAHIVIGKQKTMIGKFIKK